MIQKPLARPGDAVLFDLDGTIINSLAVASENLKRTLDVFGIEPPSSETRSGLFTRGETEILKELGFDGDFLEEVRNEWANQTNLHAAELSFFDGMQELILRLKAYGCPVGVVTGRTRKHFQDIPIGSQIARMMDVIVLEGDTPESKPNPQPLLFALEQLGVLPDRAFYIGDSPNDMQCAVRAGCRGILVTWGVAGDENGFPYPPHQVVNDPQELEWLLLGRNL